ncbi:MAG: antibiotic biosynthesis monooxygenase [Deltaproteobacteria bacterium]|nr:antibiotic biosynthesis monooxygenase [Deltaproteobacteria bacterium]
MHVMINQFRLRPESAEDCLSVIEEYVAEVKAREPGVVVFEAYRQPDGVSFTQVVAFKDGKAELDHRDTDHGRKFRDSVAPLCDIPPGFTPGELVASTR